MIKVKEIKYSNADSTFQGVVAWDTSLEGQRPLVLVAHTFKGQTKFEEEKAVKLAEMGYVGFAIDMYGAGIRATSPEEAADLMNELDRNRELLLNRIQLALKTGSELEIVNPRNIAAIGFCFGGKCVLDLARSGAKIRGVVTFHGVYDPPNMDHKNPVVASMLILHGWEDPLATPQQMQELAEELTRLKAEWNIHAYGHTGHAFTNPNANSRADGMFFSKTSNNRAWQSMRHFLEEIFR